MRIPLFLAALFSFVFLPLAAGSAEEVTTGLADEEGTLFAAEEPAQAKSAVIEDGKTVSLEYILTLDDGTIVENNIMGNPLVFEQGSGAVIQVHPVHPVHGPPRWQDRRGGRAS